MPEAVTAGFPLSLQQKHLWNLRSGQPGAVQAVVLLEGEIDSEQLKTCLQNLVARHEILRTTFQRSSGMKLPYQVVHDSMPLEWDVVDLRGASDQDERIQKLLSPESASHVVNVENAPFACDLIAMAPRRWLLVLTLSEMCADDESLSQLVRQGAEEYSGVRNNDSQVLQYADYSEWQNELLLKSDEDAEGGRRHWDRKELNPTPAFQLPFERTGQSSGCSATGSFPVEFDSAQNNLSLYRADFFLTAWQVFLARITGQPQLSVGYVSAGREHEELRGAIGVFSKALPVYTNFDGGHAFSDALQDTQQQLAKCAELQDYADPAAWDLKVGFSAIECPSSESVGNVVFTIQDRGVRAAHFQLELRCVQRDDTWNLALVYDGARFRADVVKGLADGFSELVRVAANDPSTKLSLLPVVGRAERQLLVETFNKTARVFPQGKNVSQLFEQQARLYSDRPALRCGETAFTFSQLNARSNQLAHVLRSRGIKSNVAVGLCAERSAEMIVGLLGIIKAGGCYVPLVPENPPARLAHQLAETNSPVIVTQASLLARLPEFSGTIICLDGDSDLLNQQPTASPEPVNSLADLVYVIYTSGSTGTPKGVAITHSNLLNYSQFICELLGTENQNGGLNFATVSTISADLGNTCIFPSLISGGCLHVIDYETAMSANLFGSYMAKHPIDVLKITPSHLASLLAGEDAQKILPRQYLLTGGEALSWELVDRLRQMSGCHVVNHYGPTETTIGCCTFSLASNDVSEWSPATVPIGRPIANDRAYIFDQHLQLVPIGFQGELCIGGAGLAPGYLKQPSQTAERFVQNPFSAEPSTKLYRTGDLARFLPDGNIEFLGRIDQQVKIRGFRVEPAEIEAALMSHSGITRAVVTAYTDESGEKRIAAYVISAKMPAAQELRTFLLSRIPDYMVPSAFIEIDKVPLTANGKIDFRSLPAVQAESAKKLHVVAPRTPEEEQLVTIWSEVLKLENVSADSNFFEIGGHSLLAMQIISRVRDKFRVQVPLHGFLAAPTIAAMATAIKQAPMVETEEEEMARLLAELEDISDEEAERLLAVDSQKEGESTDSSKNS